MENETLKQSAARTSPYNVRPLEANEGQTWDAFVRQSPQGTLFHTTKWLLATGLPYHIYGCFRQETLIGGMVLVSNGKDIAAPYYHCGPYLGIVLPPPSAKYLTTLALHRNITAELANYAKKQFRQVACWMGPDVVDLQPFIWAGYTVHLLYTFCVDLCDLDQAWKNMEDKRRNDIRKAERDGITIDDAVGIEEILPLIEKTYERQEKEIYFAPVAIRVAQLMRQNNQCRCFVARDKAGTALAGICVVWDEKTAYYFLGGYNAVGHRGAGALAIWHAMRYAHTVVGVQRFDLLGGGLRQLERFFRDFGGNLKPTFAVQWEQPSLTRDLKRVMGRVKRIFKRSR